jgi:hypothetical protein
VASLTTNEFAGLSLQAAATTLPPLPLLELNLAQPGLSGASPVYLGLLTGFPPSAS